MAQGDVVFFDSFLVGVMKGEHDLDTDEIYVGITRTTTPTATTADPRWTSTGTTNFLIEEVTAGGTYTANGRTVSGVVAASGGASTFDGDDITWTQNASNPNFARWGIIWNNTHATKACIGFVDLGSTFDMTTGDLSITWGSSIASLDQAP